MSDKLKPNWVRVQVNPERVVCLDGGKWHGWLFSRHPDGQLVSCKKLNIGEIILAGAQLNSGKVCDGRHNVFCGSAGRCG